MSRLPLQTLLHRAQAFAVTQSPSRLTSAYPPRLSALYDCRHSSFLSSAPPLRHCFNFEGLPRNQSTRLRGRFKKLRSPRLRRDQHTLQHIDQYTPSRIPNAAWPYLYKQFDKMPHLDPYFKQVDALQDGFIERLREAVAIPSISSEDQRRPDVVKVSLIVVVQGIAYE